MSKQHTLKQDFFKTWSFEMAYMLGYFAADGSMIEHKNGGYYIEFTSTDRVLLEQIVRIVDSSHKISERPLRDEKWKKSYRIQIGSRTWFDDLMQLGFTPHKSLTLQFPDVPELYLGDFVRGYFDGDGCVYFKEHWAADRNHYRWVLQTLFTSGSLSFLQTLLEKLRDHEIKKGFIVTKARGFDLKFSNRDSLALYNLMYHTGQIAGLFLPRKREKLEQAIQVLGLDEKCGRGVAG